MNRLAVAMVPDIDHNQVSAVKRDWNSLPVEIKQKVIKYLPLNTRFSVMTVSKPWRNMVKQVNSLETKLLLLHEYEFRLLDDLNPLCDDASHTFDRSSILEVVDDLFDDDEALQLAKNFPNLRAFRSQLDSLAIAKAFGLTCRKLEHFSNWHSMFHDHNHGDQDLAKITCLDSRNKEEELVHLPNLKYYSNPIPSSDLLGKLLSNNLVGLSMSGLDISSSAQFRSQCLTVICKHLDSIEVLYDLNLSTADPRFVALLPRMTKLTTIYVEKGSLYGISKSLDNKSLLNCNWITSNDGVWTESALSSVFASCGHRLNSLRIRIRLHPVRAIKAILSTCPGLEELFVEHPHMQRYPGNSLRELKMLQQFTKLKKCEIGGYEVDVKMLRMLDTKSPELKQFCRGGGSMTVKQLLDYQHLLKTIKELR